MMDFLNQIKASPDGRQVVCVSVCEHGRHFDEGGCEHGRPEAKAGGVPEFITEGIAIELVPFEGHWLAHAIGLDIPAGTGAFGATGARLALEMLARNIEQSRRTEAIIKAKCGEALKSP